MVFVRFESRHARDDGRYPGVFALANELARAGRLTEADCRLWRASNTWFDRAYPDPASVDATLFDKAVNPVVSCWFKDSATHLLARVPAHLALLDRYGIAWVERRATDPGTVLYEDLAQVVVAPRPVGSTAP